MPNGHTRGKYRTKLQSSKSTSEARLTSATIIVAVAVVDGTLERLKMSERGTILISTHNGICSDGDELQRI